VALAITVFFQWNVLALMALPPFRCYRNYDYVVIFLLVL
jgi:hypothetical protein